MRKQLTYIAPLRAGIVLGMLYGILSLLIVPFLVLSFAFTARTGGAFPAIFGIVFAVMAPILYGVLGFIGGLLAAALYNLIAKWTGGLVIETRDLAPPVY